MSGGDAQKGRRVAVIGVSSLLLVAMVIAVTVDINQNGLQDDVESNSRNHVASTMRAVQTVCHPTEYKKECVDALTSEAEAGNVTDPKELIKIAFNVTIRKIAIQGDHFTAINMGFENSAEFGPTGMDSCFYAEYHNYGPGSDKSKRVKWPGIWNINSKVAHHFAPSKYFHGADWIEETGIPFFAGIPEHKKHQKTVLKW
ncbi:hypothetical protein TSUD_31900 [Trifolium subterraneum]|uniref:Uncharacterized protein n=1 Tax=Trifolium subterraneum TaxID=3900 RepID=A0A2Z6MHS6_TRISU|nr:hypothetical protein TSUD_31900 [Trifolium subterraneum]